MPVGKFTGEGRRRRRVAQADHDQRGIADRAQLGPAIEPGERATGRGEVFRLGGTQARLALLGDLGMRGKEVVGKHALQRRRQDRFHAATFDPFGHGMEGALALRWDGGAGVDQDQPVEQPAVPDRQFHRDEAAEAVAQQVGLAGQAELGQLLGDAVGHLFEPGSGRRRGTESGQVDQPDAPLGRQAGRDAIEGGAIGKQRVQQHQVAALAHLHDVERGSVGGHACGLITKSRWARARRPVTLLLCAQRRAQRSGGQWSGTGRQKNDPGGGIQWRQR